MICGALLAPLRPWSPHPTLDEVTRTTPGGVVAEFRRIRGLD